jgi:hypothetical protein
MEVIRESICSIGLAQGLAISASRREPIWIQRSEEKRNAFLSELSHLRDRNCFAHAKIRGAQIIEARAERASCFHRSLRVEAFCSLSLALSLILNHCKMMIALHI